MNPVTHFKLTTLPFNAFNAFNDHCQSCTFLLKRMESCPRSYIFNQGDVIGSILELVWVFSSLLPFALFAGMLVYSITKRTSRNFLMLVNLSIQQIVCALLKKMIAQARPPGACSSTYGYPSSHSGFAASMTVWLILEILLLNGNVTFKFSKWYLIKRNSFVLFAPLIPISRYFLNYHSIEQIVCGLIVGTLCTTIYFVALLRHLQPSKDGELNSYILKTWKKYNFYHNFEISFSAVCSKVKTA